MNMPKCQICKYRTGTHFLPREDIDFYLQSTRWDLSIWVCNKCPYLTGIMHSFFERLKNVRGKNYKRERKLCA